MEDKIKRVLTMVEQGKISAAEGAKLIESIRSVETVENNINNEECESKERVVVVGEKIEDDKEPVEVSTHVENQKQFNEKMFKIRIFSSDGDKIRVTLPLKFIKGMIATFGTIPNVNLQGMDGVNSEDIMKTVNEAIDNGTLGEIVNIESNDGDIIKIIIE